MISSVSSGMINKIGYRACKILVLPVGLGRLRGMIRLARGGLVSACCTALVLLMVALLAIAALPPGLPAARAEGNQPPNRPSNVLPADGATGTSLVPTLSSSTFFDPDPGDTHAASQWQITPLRGSHTLSMTAASIACIL